MEKVLKLFNRKEGVRTLAGGEGVSIGEGRNREMEVTSYHCLPAPRPGGSEMEKAP